MGATVIVNFRTVVHKGSTGIATSVPDVCKTPAPPAPPVPIPYPNIAKSSDADKGSKKVKMDGKPIMLKNSKFSRSMGDEAGTLKGIVSSTNMGVAKFALYSFDVKVEGKNVPRLGDMMLTNGNSPNSMTPAEAQATTVVIPPNVCDLNIDCKDKKENSSWDDCMVEELCKTVTEFNEIPKDKIKRIKPSPSRGSTDYKNGLETFANRFADAVEKGNQDENWIKSQFSSECRYKKWNEGKPPPPRNPRPPRKGPNRLQPDHVHDAGLNGPLTDVDGLKWLHGRVNGTVGAAMRVYNPDKHDKVTASKCCDS